MSLWGWGGDLLGFGFCLLAFVWELVFFHCHCKITVRILPRSQFRQGLRRNRHLIGLKKISPVLQVGAEQALLFYRRLSNPLPAIPFYAYMFSLLRGWGFGSQRLPGWVFITLWEIQRLGFCEGQVGWDGLNQFRVCLWLREGLVLIFTKLTEVCKTSWCSGDVQ